MSSVVEISTMILNLEDKNLWKRPFYNAGRLLMGRGVQAVLSIGYMAFATRALGVSEFGILVLIHSSVFFVRQIFGFYSWQMIMRYGANALTAGSANVLRPLVIFACKIEAAAALIGTLLVLGLSAEALELFDIPPQYLSMLQIYSIVIVFALMSDVGLGILRLFDRHNLISLQITISPTIRFIGSGALLVLQGSLFDFILLWVLSIVISKGVLLYMGLKVLKANLSREESTASNKAEVGTPLENFKAIRKDAWRYSVGTNFHSSLGADVAPLLISTVLGPAGAALWRVAQKFAAVVGQPLSKTLLPAISTDMAWLNAGGSATGRRAMVYKAGALAGGISMLLVLVLTVVGEAAIKIVVGEEFVAAYSTMVVLTLATALNAFAFGLSPLAMTAGRVWSVTLLRVISMGIFCAIIVPMVNYWGIVGAGIATVVRTVVYIFMTFWLVRDLLTDGTEKEPITR